MTISIPIARAQQLPRVKSRCGVWRVGSGVDESLLGLERDMAKNVLELACGEKVERRDGGSSSVTCDIFQ